MTAHDTNGAELVPYDEPDWTDEDFDAADRKVKIVIACCIAVPVCIAGGLVGQWFGWWG